MPIWNPWHGCTRISPGCMNCYVYRRDETIGKDSSIVTKTSSFDLPIRKTRNGEYKLGPESGPVYACMTSDFFLDKADEWRDEIWDMIRERNDLDFVIVTKRIHRFFECIPKDWKDGWDNVTICCTCENQETADFRLPIFLSAPIKHRNISHEPMLGNIEIERFLETGKIDFVLCGGESGEKARPCDYDWILNTRRQCMKYRVPFHFKQTGAYFRMNGKLYTIPRKLQMSQAAKAGIDYNGYF